MISQPPFYLDRLTLLTGATRTANEPSILKGRFPAWTSFAAIFKADESPAQGPYLVQIDLAVLEGSVEVGLARPDDKIADGWLLTPSEGRVTATLFARDLSKIDALVLRSMTDQPLAVQVFSVTTNPLAPAILPSMERTLTAFYDLRRNPASFDFSMFLMAAEIERHDRMLEDIFVVFLPPDHNARYYLPGGYDAVIDAGSRLWRMENILIAMLSLYPNVQGHALLTDRRQGYALNAGALHAYPPPATSDEIPIHLDYQRVLSCDAFTPGSAHRRPQATAQGLRYAQQWLEGRAKGRKPVTITLRQYGFDKGRNSDLDAWRRFLESLDLTTYFPIMIPDTDVALSAPPPGFENCAVMPEAAFNLGLRMGLYASAWLNLATNGGPMMLLMLGSNPAIIYGIHNAQSDFGSRRQLETVGYQMGQQPAFCGPFQRLVWERDAVETISGEFQRMAALLNQREQTS
ncbi:MAG: hypothetical protein HQL43_03915 [Alphaproteobacteria bacterium]|nr:hypothetical protein [Alphaproteobacteria bacterium]